MGSLLLQGRYQLLFGVLLSCILPLLLRVDMGYAVVLRTPTQINATIASFCAVVVGYYFFQRLTRFPGVESIAYIFPVFSITFAAVLVFVLFFRIGYSRYVFLLSYLICQTWFHVVFFANRRLLVPSFAIIPGGQAAEITSVPNSRWRVLDKPDLARVPRNGIVTDLRADHSKDWEKFIADAALAGVPVYHFKQVKESITGQVEIEHLSENTLGSLQPDGVYSTVKIVVDWIGCWILMPVILPLFALVAIAIKLDSRGPVFYRQERIGFRGVPFVVWKFRTMKHDQCNAGDDRARAATSEDDPRITRVGKILRRFRLDELPQIFNIILGQMSWIGPRPEPAVLSVWFERELPFYRYRHIVRPGITGWAQVNQGYAVGVENILRKLHYDFYYIKNYSIWLDMLITVKTIRTILTGIGAR